jgi:HlyD family secretion protein
MEVLAMSKTAKHKKRKWPWVIGTLLIAAVGAVLFVNYQMSSQKAQLSQDLSTTTLKRTTLENSISASGNIESNSSVNVTSSLNEIVEKVNVSLGEKVKKGDVLAVLDTADLKKALNENQQSYDSAVKQYNLKVSQSRQSVQDSQNNVSNAKSDLEKAKKNYASAKGDRSGSTNYNTRYSEAEDQDQAAKTAAQTLSSAQSNLTQAQNSYDNAVANDSTVSAKEQLQTAKENLAKATVTAPVSGMISAVNISVGNTPSGGSSAAGTGTDGGTAGASAGGGGTTLFAIQSSNDFVVKASVADYDVIKLSLGKVVSVTVDSTGAAFSGKILTLSPVADSSGNYDISASIDNPSAGSLRVGMKTTVKIALEKRENIYAVPVDAIVKQDGKIYVVAIDSSDPHTVKRSNIEVTVGMETDYYAEVSGSGLKDGLNLLTDPLNKLKTSSSASGFPGLGGGKNAGSE